MNQASPAAHSERIRKAEFDLVRREFHADDRVLEIGGGSSYQATLLAEAVRECVSVDVSPYPGSIYPIEIFDGRNLPFDNDSFEIIFSSSVLEHVTDLPGLLDECARVLKPGGKMIHIVPTSWWRVWTLISYYPALPRYLAHAMRDIRDRHAAASDASGRSRNSHPDQHTKQVKAASVTGLLWRYFKPKWIRSALISPRHGERGNEITEIFYFRRSWWQAEFARNGWRVDAAYPTQLFYTGNAVLGGCLGIGARRCLSRIFGSATCVFVLVPATRP